MMDLNKSIILFKVVKTLNVGSATAIETLREAGYVVENRPTTKLSKEQYEVLINKFAKDRHEDLMNEFDHEGSQIYLSKINKSEKKSSNGENITTEKLLAKKRENFRGGTIFKYYPPSEYSFSSLRQKYLYHNSYSLFNDPFDCNINLIKFQSKKSKLKLLESLSKIGICCYSERKNSLLMWSHYASSHQGFVVEFRSENIKDGINPLQVDYKQHFEQAEIEKLQEDAIYHLIYSKSKEWEYEMELRTVIANCNNEQDRKVLFCENDVIAIYFGVKCNEENIKRISHIVKTHYKNDINFYRGTLANNSFEIKWTLKK